MKNNNTKLIEVSRVTMDYEEMLQQVKDADKKVTCLKFLDSFLGQRNNAYISRLFAAIPATVTEIQFVNNGIGTCKDRKGAIAVMFSIIPSSVTKVVFKDEWMHAASVAELCNAFAQMPPNVKELEIDDLLLNRPLKEREEIVRNIPREVHLKTSKLEFSANESNDDKVKKVQKEFEAEHIFRDECIPCNYHRFFQPAQEKLSPEMRALNDITVSTRDIYQMNIQQLKDEHEYLWNNHLWCVRNGLDNTKKNEEILDRDNAVCNEVNRRGYRETVGSIRVSAW